MKREGKWSVAVSIAMALLREHRDCRDYHLFKICEWHCNTQASIRVIDGATALRVSATLKPINEDRNSNFVQREEKALLYLEAITSNCLYCC